MNDTGDYLQNRTAAAAWRITGRDIAGCVLEVGAQTKNFTARFEIRGHKGLDRALDIIMSESLSYNPWLCVWPSIQPRPEFPDNLIRVDLDVSAGVGAIHYTVDRDGHAGSWITKTAQPEEGVCLVWDYHNGPETGVPADSIIPLDLWRQALHEYYDLIGGRPTCIGWEQTELRW
jgi:hypothetical protein